MDEHRVMAVAQPLLELDRLSSKDEDIAPVTQGGTHVNIRPGRVESLKVVVRVIGALGTRRSAYPLALLAAMESDVEEIRHHAKRLLGVIAENSILKALDSKAKSEKCIKNSREAAAMNSQSSTYIGSPKSEIN